MMMLAKYHLSEQVKEDLQCSVCFDYDYQLLQCQGPCHKIICQVCSRRLHYRECPFCGQGCKVDYLPPKKEEKLFLCPHGCSQTQLFTEEEYYQHGKKCGFSQGSSELHKQFVYREEYKCNKGHLLKFPLFKTNCSYCEEYHYTSECRPCGLRICTACRPPPCSKQECPLGHIFQHNNSSSSVICDLCGISLGGMATKSVYCDRACNFDICQTCYSKQPAEHPQPNYRNQELVRQEDDDTNDYYAWQNPMWRQGAGRRLPVGTIENLEVNQPQNTVVEAQWVPAVQPAQESDSSDDYDEIFDR